MILKEWVNNENWLKVMNVFSLLSLSENINLRADVSLSNLRELSLHVVSECTEFLHIN